MKTKSQAVTLRKFKSSAPSKAHYKWAVYWPGQKGRKRKLFSNKVEAELFQEDKKIEQTNLGTQAADINDDIKIQALEAARKLAPYGKTIQEAVTFYVDHLESTIRSATVAELIQAYLQAQIDEGKSSRHIDDLRSRLRRFEKDHGGALVAEITTPKAEDFLFGLQGTNQTRNNYRTILSGFFGFAERRGYTQANPISSIPKFKAGARTIQVFTPAELTRLLDSATGEILAFIALGAFGGLRTAEITGSTGKAGLRWEDVKLDRKIIDLSGFTTKTAKRRLVEIADNAAAFIKDVHKGDGPVIPSRFYFNQALIEFKREMANQGVKWKANGLRHSFGSYHLAKHEDSSKTALQLGHSDTAVVFEHYREVVTPEDAELYWSIYPKGHEKRKIIAV